MHLKMYLHANRRETILVCDLSILSQTKTNYLEDEPCEIWQEIFIEIPCLGVEVCQIYHSL